MLVTELYDGQGLGNQLWCYAVTRCIAKTRGYTFGIVGKEKFKGKGFLDIDFGQEVKGRANPEPDKNAPLPNDIFNYYAEKLVRHPITSLDISKPDLKLQNICDNSKIDGGMQSVSYINPFKSELRIWIKEKTDRMIKWPKDEDVCIVHVRGGDFLASSALLGRDYYQRGVSYMLNRNKNMKFFLITDDLDYARVVCPNIPLVGGSSFSNGDPYKAQHHKGGEVWIDWSILRHAKNAIISASSFSFWPTWLNEDVLVTAPMFWAAHKQSDGYWSTGDILVDGWNYIHRDGTVYTSQQCREMKSKYENQNQRMWE